MKYLFTSFLFSILCLPTANDQSTYVVKYVEYYIDDTRLRQAEQLPEQYASYLVAIHYMRTGAELVYSNGQSEYRYTGEDYFPDSVEVTEHKSRTSEDKVWKNHTSHKTISYNQLYPGACREISNNFPENFWTITQEFKRHGVYTVQRAYLTDMPEVEAWFCPAINIPDGPFKASGLPGLILDYKNKQKRFVMTSIEKLPNDKQVKPGKPECNRYLNIKEYNNLREKSRH